jgi:hypothetical protein
MAEARRDPSLQNTLDIEALLRTGGSEEGSDDIVYETLSEMAEGVVVALRSAQLTPEVISDYVQRLADYRVIDALHELKLGDYIRWLRRVPGENEVNRPRKLIVGGNVADIVIEDDSAVVKVHLIPRGWIHKMRFNDNFVFRKLTEDEKMMFMAQDLLDNEEDLDSDSEFE